MMPQCGLFGPHLRLLQSSAPRNGPESAAFVAKARARTACGPALPGAAMRNRRCGRHAADLETTQPRLGVLPTNDAVHHQLIGRVLRNKFARRFERNPVALAHREGGQLSKFGRQ